MTIPSCFVR